MKRIVFRRKDSTIRGELFEIVVENDSDRPVLNDEYVIVDEGEYEPDAQEKYDEQ